MYTGQKTSEFMVEDKENNQILVMHHVQYHTGSDEDDKIKINSSKHNFNLNSFKINHTSINSSSFVLKYKGEHLMYTPAASLSFNDLLSGRLGNGRGFLSPQRCWIISYEILCGLIHTKDFMGPPTLCEQWILRSLDIIKCLFFDIYPNFQVKMS